LERGVEPFLEAGGRIVSSKAVQTELIALLPNLRAFAISLCGDADRADDLLQETVLKAWKHLDSFTEGTNLRAWLFTILRNTFLSHLRKRRDEVSLNDEDGPGTHLSVPPAQLTWLGSKDLIKAMGRLTYDQRAAIILVGAEGFTYEEAAAICHCAVGTIKSRVNRARVRLDILDITETSELTDNARHMQLAPARLSA
jgi:RNA polymerase sigma-70 factor (ECF subfamily)